MGSSPIIPILLEFLEGENNEPNEAQCASLGKEQRSDQFGGMVEIADPERHQCASGERWAEGFGMGFGLGKQGEEVREAPGFEDAAAGRESVPFWGGVMLSTNQLIWEKASRTFVAEISEVQNHFRRLYPDSADIGLEIQSERTRRIAKFVRVEVHCDPNDPGEILWYLYKPDQRSINAIPELKDIKLILFND